MDKVAAIEAILPLKVKGEIVKGFGRGSRELGFPTANFSEEVIETVPQAIVGGIYCGFAQVDQGPVLDMVMSVGFNPFFNNEKRAMETHIVHKFDGDLYGRMLSVIIVGYLRPEANYESLDLLVKAIEGDIENGQKRNMDPTCSVYKDDPFFKSS